MVLCRVRYARRESIACSGIPDPAYLCQTVSPYRRSIPSWHDAEPRFELSSLAERSAVVDGSNDRRLRLVRCLVSYECVCIPHLRQRSVPVHRLTLPSCCLTSFHSLHNPLIRLRISNIRLDSAFSRMSAGAALSLAGVRANTGPRSSRNALSWLIADVRRTMNPSRSRWIACKSS